MTMGRSSSATGRRIIAVALALAVFAGACTSHDNAGPTTTRPDDSTTTTEVGDGPGPTPGVHPFAGIRLSKGTPQASAAQPVPVVNGATLDDASIQAVIDRLPAWNADGSLEQPFKWPAETIHPPQAGATSAVVFPSPDQVPPAEVPSGPLHVLRVQPEGDVAIAPFASITFDQPMVPVGTVGQLASAAVPATITPAVPGQWQWIGTRTLRFDGDSDVIDRLPMATTYTIEIPAGTRSASGGELADAVTFQFTTPPVTVQSFQPTGPSQPLTPVFVATFDQRIDPAAVLATVVVQADGNDQPMQLATANEIAADPSAQQVVDIVPAGRWLAFRPTQPFAADAAITIEIGPGTPSAEGPATTAAAQRYTAHTYEPLELTSVECGFGSGCVPGSEFDLVFNNALDADRFDPATIGIQPAIAGVTVGVSGNTIIIRGNTTANTEYTVTIPSGLTDTFGQQLGDDETRTISTGDAIPFLQGFNLPFTTIDPSADPPSISVASLGHDELRVRIFAAQPSDWPGFPQQISELMYEQSSKPPAPKWPLLSDTTIDVEGDGDTIAETQIDLSAALPDGVGHVIVIVEPTEQYPLDSNEYWMNRPAITWVQSTDLGVDAFSDNDELRAWITDLASGAPVRGATVRLLESSGTASTNEDGVARLTQSTAMTTALLATVGNDTAMLPNGYFGGGWYATPSSDTALWYVFDDRQIYRPTETASVKGWVRRLTSSTSSQVQLFAGDTAVHYTARDSQGNVIAEGNTDVNPLGGFDLTIAVPEGANLGEAYLELSLSAAGIGAQQYTHMFQIQEFRRPEFEVATRADSEGPYVNGEPLTVAVDASYYAGGPLGAAPVDWQVTAAAGTYSPPGWDEFEFGRWTPWWYEDRISGGPASDVAVDGDFCCGPPEQATDVQQYTGTTDAAGHDYLQIGVGDLGDELAGLPVAVTTQATVEDVNRQALSSRTTLLVHPADFYVGLRGERTFVRRGDPLDIDVIVTDIDGNAVEGRNLQVTASRTETVFENGTWTDHQVDAQTCDITSGTEAVPCSFATTVGGTYTISAAVLDDQDRASLSELTRWVSSADSVPDRTVQQQQLTIVPDQAEYQPGDTAQLLVQAPFTAGTGLLVIARNGIRSTATFDLVDGSAVVQVPVADADIPNLDVSIEVVGSAPRVDDNGDEVTDAPHRPAFAAGGLTLHVSTAARALTVTATPQASELQPGDSTQVDVAVTDAAGQPVAGGDLAVVVVDEAVLALSAYQLGDPLSAFYSQLPSMLTTQFGRQSIVLVNPANFLAGRDGSDESGGAAATDAPSATTAPVAGAPEEPGAAGDAAAPDGGQPTGTPIDVRTNFDALAVFAPEVVTDASGHATVDVPLPDNLTRYRVMVVAVAGQHQFGSGEANITARLPLMVRPSAPRFLNFGDAIELPVVVQNQTDAAMEVDVVLQTSNLAPAAATGRRVSVPANDRVEVRFPVAAAAAGTARFRVSAVSGDAADAATVDLPVYTPATAEAFATYGVVDDGAIVQPVDAPEAVIPQFGGLDISTSSTSLQALTDAVIYLSEYPYESSDALSSRILAIAALRDVLDAFDAPGLPAAGVLQAAVDRDVGLLVAMQNDDGGFPFWSRSRPSEPFNSIQAAHALIAARDAGYAVPGETISRALAFVTDIEQHIPPEYSQDVRDTLSAYALNVRMVAGDRDPAKAEALYDDRGSDLPLDAIAWLWPVIDDQATSAAIERLFGNRAVDTAGAVTFTTEVSDDAYVTLSSDRRTDGLILDALILERPNSDLIPKVVNGLLAGQHQGRWDNVQENSFILLALKRYFDAYESQTPDFVARVWLGQQFAGDQAFAGRSTDRNLISIPTAQLQQIGDATLTIAKEGTGRLYYRIGLRTAPADLALDPLDRGFTVSRSYEAVDDPADVSQDADGTWHIKAGARVRVRLTMVAESQRTHVGLIDPLPAGLEIMNPALAVTGDVPTDPGSDDGVIDFTYPWYPTWFDHQNLRDDRAEAFSTYLPAGTYDYSYVARATTPGTFVAPPTRAEEIYAPETFGRASTDTVIIAG